MYMISLQIIGEKVVPIKYIVLQSQTDIELKFRAVHGEQLWMDFLRNQCFGQKGKVLQILGAKNM